jgi:hypothetical protein
MDKLGLSGRGCDAGLCPCTPPKDFLKKVLWNPKNFQKGLFFTNLVGLKDKHHHFLL